MSDNISEREIHRLAIASDGVNNPLEARFCNGEPIMTIRRDGRIEVSDKLKPDEIAATVLEMMKEQWLTDPQAKKIRELQERIKRLEEAGNNLLWNFCPEYTSDLTQEQSDAVKQWNKAKEAKS